MMLARRIRRLAALAAAFGIALQALWPVLAQARPADATLRVALCGVEVAGHAIEIKFGKTTPLDERAARHGEHCKLCSLGADRPMVSSFPEFLLCGSLEGRQENVIEAAALHRDSSAASLARPRAPPISL
jgi:hypothetical protein